MEPRNMVLPLRMKRIVLYWKRARIDNRQKPKSYQWKDVAVPRCTLNLKARPYRERIELVDTRMRIVALL